MPDEAGGRVDDPRDEDLAVGQLDILEDPPFVLMSGIGGLDAQCCWPHLQQVRQYLPQGDATGVRSLVISPADVQAHS